MEREYAEPPEEPEGDRSFEDESDTETATATAATPATVEGIFDLAEAMRASSRFAAG